MSDLQVRAAGPETSHRRFLTPGEYAMYDDVPWEDEEVARWFGHEGVEAVTAAILSLPTEFRTTEVFETLKHTFDAGVFAAARLTNAQEAHLISEDQSGEMTAPQR